MKLKLLFAGALVLWLLPAACGGSNGDSTSTPSSSDATYQAARNEAEKTPVADAVRSYAKQLCEPVTSFLGAAGSAFEQLDSQPTAEGTVSLEDALSQAFEALGQLKGPIEDLRDAVNDIDPPPELRDYHQALLDEIDYALDAVDAISKNGFGGALTLPTPEATPQEPAGFQAAIIQECGEDIKPFFDQFGGDFSLSSDFFGGGSDATATPLPPGIVGRAVTAGDFALTVNGVTNPYESSDEFNQPEAGRRWVLIDVSLENVSDQTKDYSSFDFSLRDADDFSYDRTFIGVDRALDFGTLRPGETIRGNVAFELPVDARPARLIYEPGFFGEGRIDVLLR